MDIKTFYKILGQAKRAFSHSETVKEKYKSERIETPKILESGRKSKTILVSYKCQHCQELFKKEETQCDHINPVVPVQIPGRHMSWDVLIEERLCVNSLDELQILCKPCHKIKSSRENKERKVWVKKTKYIVYMTTNKVNGKRYIGVHKCVNLDDGYLGSGYALKDAFKKYGKDKFYRKVLYVFDNANEAYDKEKELVTKDIVNDESYYNLVGGGKFSGIMANEVIAKIKASRPKTRKSHLNIKVTATNIYTGETRTFDSILQCCKALGLSYGNVLKVCKRKENCTQHRGWTFETSKYGKSLDLNKGSFRKKKSLKKP